MRVRVEVIQEEVSVLRDSVKRWATSWVRGRRTHTVFIDGDEADTSEGLFNALSRGLEFPGYFGRNWDALNECFFEYFVLEDGGLGSYYGGRDGVDAQGVIVVFLSVASMIKSNESVLSNMVHTISYTAEANESHKAADLWVIFQLHPAESENTVDQVRRIIESHGLSSSSPRSD